MRGGEPEDDFLTREERALLRLGERPVARSLEERARTAARINRLALAPSAPAWAWTSAKLVAGLSAVGGTCAVLVAVLVRHPGPARPAPRPTQGVHAAPTAPVRHSARTPEARGPWDGPVVVPAAGADAGAPGAAPRIAAPTPAPRGHESAPAPALATVRQRPIPPAPTGPEVAPPLPSARPTASRDAGLGSGAPEASALTRETLLLSRAQAVVADDPREALARLEVYSAAFPHGQLAAEREFIAVEALVRLGNAADARRRGEAFLATYPHDLHVERVRQLLATERDR